MCLWFVDIRTGLGGLYIYFVCYYYVPVTYGHRDRTLRVVYIFCVFFLCGSYLWT